MSPLYLSDFGYVCIRVIRGQNFKCCALLWPSISCLLAATLQCYSQELRIYGKNFLRLFCALLLKLFEPIEYLPPSPSLGTLSSMALNGGEGRGEEALLKTPNVPSHRFNLWFVGSRGRAGARLGLPYDLPTCRPLRPGRARSADSADALIHSGALSGRALRRLDGGRNIIRLAPQ